MTRRPLAGLVVGAMAAALVAALPPANRPARAAAGPPLADAQGLEFSATLPADPQRDEAEPHNEIDKVGNIYTCGPTRFTTGADYMQVSTDGGDSFHLLGVPPRGQLAPGGGGDCGLATAVDKNAQGNYQLAYTGLSYSDFSTATSPDNGETFLSTPTSISGVTDRQWMAFSDADTVFLSYNDIAPRNTVVQRSDDGGLTYGTKTVAAPAPLFPGQLRADPDPAHNPGGSGPLVYFAYSLDSSANLAVSQDGGTTWRQCLVATTDAPPSAGFVTVDSDVDGNLYLAYTEEGADYHTYFTSLPVDKIDDCQNVDENPGWSTPVQVDRGKIGTSLFSWIAAGGEPGRVAVTFYGTETRGNPNTSEFKATWDVYVNQTLDGLSAAPHFSQVKATTHPFHYDSICLDGLACTATGGDRSLADFYAMDYDPVTKRLVVVYDQGSKIPGELEGHVATPAVLVQRAGPSLGGGLVPVGRPVVGTGGPDPEGDAIAPYSGHVTVPNKANRPALDITSVKVGPEIDLESGDVVADGGFTVTMTVKDLSTVALTDAATQLQSGTLLFLFRFVDGFQAASASASWSVGQGFDFGFDDYTLGGVQCVGAPSTADPGVPEKCLIFPGAVDIAGDANQDSGVIRLSVPRSLLHELRGGTGPEQRPEEVDAKPGARFYDGTAFTLASLSPVADVQGFSIPVDNAPSFDFFLPASPAAPTSGPTAGPGSGPSGGPSSAPTSRPRGPVAAPGGGLPSTGGLGAPVLAALVVLAAALVVRRRRRWGA